MGKLSFIETIRASRHQAEKGQYEQALIALQPLFDQTDLRRAQKEQLALQKLHVFNRLQWVPEAAAIAEELKQYWGWGDETGLEKLEPEQALELALLHVLIGDLAAAESLYKAALAKNKSSTLYCSELAILFEQQGRQASAIKLYEQLLSRAIQKKHVDAPTVRAIGRLSGLRDFSLEEIQALESLTKKHAGEPTEVRMLYSLARALGRKGGHQREIEFLLRANRLNAEAFAQTGANRSVAESRERRKALAQIFDQPVPDWTPQYRQSDFECLFILGMPRSGTTLLEQIVGAHSLVGNSGESRAMGIALNRVLKAKPVASGAVRPFSRYKLITADDSALMINYYQRYQHFFSDCPIVTDKELSNVDRIGLIANMFPRAKFLAIRRHPLDVCASIMQQDFSMAYFANSSLDCVQEYIEYYQKVEHWQSLYPDRFFSLDYESLVGNFENYSRAIIRFIGLEWEDGINEFYTRSNSVRTPSLSQVRSRINADSVAKWKRYKQLVQPAEAYLEATGYDYKKVQLEDGTASK